MDKDDQLKIKFQRDDRAPASLPPGADPIVAYEIVVRPAFGYPVEESANKVQIFQRKKKADLPIEKINGGGVFLWTIHAVTASGRIGPDTKARWLEIKFPKLLVAPQLIKPIVQ